MSEEELAAIIERVAYVSAAIANDTRLTSKETQKKIRLVVGVAVKEITEGME